MCIIAVLIQPYTTTPPARSLDNYIDIEVIQNMEEADKTVMITLDRLCVSLRTCAAPELVTSLEVYTFVLWLIILLAVESRFYILHGFSKFDIKYFM